MKKFDRLYNRIISQQSEYYDNAKQNTYSLNNIIKILKDHGHTIQLTDQPNIIVVIDGYSQNNEWHNDVLKLNNNGSIQSISTGDTYKNILTYLGY